MALSAPMGVERTPTGWLAAYHGKLSFAFLVYLFTTLTFCLVAIILGGVMPALPSLGIAVGVAIAIVAAIWPAQSRFYAEVRARVPRP